jgi:hypothetical protein
MAIEEFRDDVERALQQAIANDEDLDDVERVLDDIHDRVEELRIVRGDAR